MKLILNLVYLNGSMQEHTVSTKFGSKLYFMRTDVASFFKKVLLKKKIFKIKMDNFNMSL